jgi:hypothetical protein
MWKFCQFPATPPQNIADCVHPCPCGYYNGPMMDRIDIHIQVPRVLKLAEALHVIPVKTG